MKIKLDTLTLVTFDKENIKHVAFLKELIKDETILKWFSGITNNLLHNHGDEFFYRSFFVQDANENLVAYMNIGAYNEGEKAVYLRSATRKAYRGKGIGKTLLLELTDYIFKNYNQVDMIKLKIDNENKPSIATANACGYKWILKDYYGKLNPNLLKDNNLNK